MAEQEHNCGTCRHYEPSPVIGHKGFGACTYPTPNPHGRTEELTTTESGTTCRCWTEREGGGDGD